MPDPTSTDTIVVLVPTAAAIAIATVIGYWVRKRMNEKKPPKPPQN